MSAMTETPARPPTEPTDRGAVDLREQPIPARGSPIPVDLRAVDVKPPDRASARARIDVPPSDAELWFG